jgi:hypothetical protein
VIEGEGSAKHPHQLDHDDKAQCTSVLSMEIADGLARVVIIHRAGWKFTFFTDVDPATGVLRDIEDTVQAIVATSRWAA